MKVLVVGCGSIGSRHAANAAALADTGVFDSDVTKAAACATTAKARSFGSYDEALAWGPDVVVVATPHRHHLPVALKAIEAGADVLIEKPISDSEDGLDQFLDRADALQRRVHVVCNMRMYPGVSAMRSVLPLIGAPLFAASYFGNYLPAMRPGADYRELYAARRAAGGGVILDAIHEIDYLTWFFGPVKSVKCRAEKLSALDVDVEDYALISLEHAGGVMSSIQLDYLRQFKRRGCEIVGDDGTIIWTSEGKQPERCSVRLFERSKGRWSDVLDTDSVDVARLYRDFMQEFLSHRESGSPLLLEGRTAALELNTALRALREASTPLAERA